MLHKVCELVLNNYCTISFNSQVDNNELAVDILTVTLSLSKSDIIIVYYN